ncbi:MAG: 30S ribosomal protein S6 [Bacillota bacterium]|nr:30S ribosomal protein S6 [Bacillota bacterium]
MNKYESLYIIKSALEEEGRKQLIEKLSEVVRTNGGEVEAVEEWGLKHLAYPIEKQNDGYYVLMNFSGSSTLPEELERNLQITDDVLRYIVLRKDK